MHNTEKSNTGKSSRRNLLAGAVRRDPREIIPRKDLAAGLDGFGRDVTTDTAAAAIKSALQNASQDLRKDAGK